MTAKVGLAVLASLLPSGRHGLRQTTVDAIRWAQTPHFVLVCRRPCGGQDF